MSVKVGKLSSEMAKMLDEYSADVSDATKKTIKEVGKEAANVIREHTPSNWSKEYKSQITCATPKLEKSNWITWVYMKGEKYRIAHLLENGHAIVSGGRRAGNSEPIPHFIYGEKYAEDELPKRLKENL